MVSARVNKNLYWFLFGWSTYDERRESDIKQVFFWVNVVWTALNRFINNGKKKATTGLEKPHRLKADFERFWKERLIMKITRFALFTVSVHWAEGEYSRSTWTPRSLTNLDTGMGMSEPSGGKATPKGLLAQSEVVDIAGLIDMCNFCDQSHVAIRELWRFTLCVRGVTILTSSTMSRVSASSASRRSLWCFSLLLLTLGKLPNSATWH